MNLKEVGSEYSKNALLTLIYVFLATKYSVLIVQLIQR